MSKLNIYLVAKESNIPLPLCSFNDNSSIYKAISSCNANIKLGEYTDLTVDILRDTIEVLDGDIWKLSDKIQEYEKAICYNPKCDLIEKLNAYKEEYNDMQDTSTNLSFMRWFVNTIVEGNTNFYKVMYNIF